MVYMASTWQHTARIGADAQAWPSRGLPQVVPDHCSYSCHEVLLHAGPQRHITPNASPHAHKQLAWVAEVAYCTQGPSSQAAGTR